MYLSESNLNQLDSQAPENESLNYRRNPQDTALFKNQTIRRIKMQQETTLEKVYDRVDAMSANCIDHNVNVDEISFDSLDLLRIGGESHHVRSVAQRAISNRLGIP